MLVIPLAATIVLVGRARSLDARLQAFLAATVALTVCLIPVVATFASHFSDRIEERNTFYVAPLFSIALLAWVERGAPRPRVLAPAAAAASAALVLLVPFDRFLTTSAITDTLMLLPFWSLEDRYGLGWITFAAAALAVALAASFLFVPRRYALALPFVVLGLWAVALKPIWWGTHGFERFSRGSLFQGIRASHRDWIDRALPDGATAAFLWTGRTDRLTVNQNEFFSRSVGPVYYVVDPTPGGLPETRVRIDPVTGAVTLPNGAHVDDRVPRRGLVLRARRDAAGAGQGMGRQPVARAPAARLGRPDRRSLPERHLVGEAGDVAAAALRTRRPRRHHVERPWALPRSADRRRAVERQGRRARRASSRAPSPS